MRDFQELTEFLFHTDVPVNLIMGVAIPLLLLLVSQLVPQKMPMER